MEDKQIAPQRRIFGLEPKVAVTLIMFFVAAAAAVFVFTFSRAKGDDLRTAVPAEALAFLYIRDVSEIEPYLDSKKTNGEKRDLSFLSGIEMAVAITGFETSEQKIADDSSILNFKPTFTVIADTRSWSWRSRGLIDGPIDEFIEAEYGKSVKRTRKASEFAELTLWTAEDGRQAFASRQGSRIFFGNNEKSLLDCLAAANKKIPDLTRDKELDSFLNDASESVVKGYFPRRAVERFAGVAGISAAVSGSEEELARTFISRLVPQLVGNTVEGVFWQGRRENGMVVDSVQIKLNSEVSAVFSETMISSAGGFRKLIDFVPPDTTSVTKYSLAKPRLAFRSLLLVTAKHSDPVSGRLISSFSGAMLEPYGIRDPEAYLDASGPHFLTVQTGAGDDETVAVTEIRDRESILASLNPEIGMNGKPETSNEAELWANAESEYAAAIANNVLIVGSREAVLRSVKRNGSTKSLSSNQFFKIFESSGAAAVTLDLDVKASNLTETSFDKHGFTRTYTSRAGLLGSLLSGF